MSESNWRDEARIMYDPPIAALQGFHHFHVLAVIHWPTPKDPGEIVGSTAL